MLVRILLFITLWLATLPTDSQTQQSIPDYVGQAPADVQEREVASRHTDDEE